MRFRYTDSPVHLIRERALAAVVLAVLFAVVPAPFATAAETSVKDIVGTEKKRYSQKNEELVIRQFFQDRKGGVFLDVGSAWPIRNSNTYYLEKHLGWSGIAVDAVERYAPLYEEKRPGTKFFSYIVTDTEGTKEKFYIAPGLPGRSSTDKARLPAGGGSVEIEVPTTTLDALLEENEIEQIDFLNMDIEGGAPKALAGFDIGKYRPELVCIEHNAKIDAAKAGALLAWFAEHDYQRIETYDAYDRINWYFTPQ